MALASACGNYLNRAALAADSPKEIVWNPRWKYEKGLELVAHIIEQVKEARLRFRLHIIGQQFRHIPEAFEAIDRHLDEIGAIFNMPRVYSGYIEDADRYQTLLAACHATLSTAMDEFQGLSV